MFGFLGFLLMLFLLIFFIGFSIISNILGMLFRVFRRKGFHASSEGSKAYTAASSSQRQASEQKRKIFSEDEGEYVDYEEVD